MSALHAAIAGIVLTLTACTDAPTGPDVRPAHAAVVESGTYIFTYDNTGFNECLGEPLHFWGASEARYHLTVTPSGRVAYSEVFVTTLEFNVVGVTSGTSWHLLGPDPAPFTSISGGGSVLNIVETFRIESEDGQRMLMKNRLVLVLDANGRPVVERADFADCTLIGPGA